MKAMAVVPGKPDSIHLAHLPKPSLDDISNGCGVLAYFQRAVQDMALASTRYG